MNRELKTFGVALLLLPLACAAEGQAQPHSPAGVPAASAAESEPNGASEPGMAKSEMGADTTAGPTAPNSPAMSKSTEAASPDGISPTQAGGTGGMGGMAGRGGRGGRGGSTGR